MLQLRHVHYSYTLASYIYSQIKPYSGVSEVRDVDKRIHVRILVAILGANLDILKVGMPCKW